MRATAGLAAILILMGGTTRAAAPEAGDNILRLYTIDSPATVSIHEEATVFSQRPMMPVFNNLVLFDQTVKQNSLASVRPELAEHWTWDAGGTRLSFALRPGVTWHDGQPFTAKDVVCTWNLLLERSADRLRVNPRRHWYLNLEKVTADDELAVTFHLKRPQPAFLALLASGFSPVYPCHVTAKEMRQRPIGTGPFRFVEFQPNKHIRLTRNPSYWMPDRPRLDGIEHTIIRNPSTAILTFIAGKVDMTAPYNVTIPLLRDVQAQAPQAICEVAPGNVSRNLLINPARPPFGNAELRRALALTLDRKAYIDILSEGQGDVGGVMQPPPEGLWGMPREVLESLPGYSPDVAKNRAEARAIMARLGYGPQNRLKLKLATRDIPPYRDPAVILLDQLKAIWVDAELEPVDTTVWFPRMLRRDYAVALNLSGSWLDDPDNNLTTGYGCGSSENYSDYCNPEVDRLIEQQSMEADPQTRRDLVWAIERKLAEDGARPIIFYTRGATCRQPYVKGITVMVNSIYNGWRMEEVWLDRGRTAAR